LLLLFLDLGRIGAKLCIGMLMVSTTILDKNSLPTPDEMVTVRLKLNGSGYPKGLCAESLDYERGTLAALDIYQALTENRPYRRGFAQQKAFEILD
jgi:hypothetical protein